MYWNKITRGTADNQDDLKINIHPSKSAFFITELEQSRDFIHIKY